MPQFVTSHWIAFPVNLKQTMIPKRVWLIIFAILINPIAYMESVILRIVLSLANSLFILFRPFRTVKETVRVKKGKKFKNELLERKKILWPFWVTLVLIVFFSSALAIWDDNETSRLQKKISDLKDYADSILLISRENESKLEKVLSALERSGMGYDTDRDTIITNIYAQYGVFNFKDVEMSNVLFHDIKVNYFASERFGERSETICSIGDRLLYNIRMAKEDTEITDKTIYIVPVEGTNWNLHVSDVATFIRQSGHEARLVNEMLQDPIERFKRCMHVTKQGQYGGRLVLLVGNLEEF